MKKRRVCLTTEVHRPAFDDFADAMRVAESKEGWRSSEVLRNFLDAAFLAVRGALIVGEAKDKNEADYMAIVASCRHPSETMGALSRMMGATAMALAVEPVDFVGPVFSELSADAGMGQFFTPHHLSYFMAKLIVGDDPMRLVGEKGFVSLAEPACGVGGMILATNVVLREAGLDVARQAHWTAIDVDSRAHRACYLQLAMTDCSADVYRGNALGPPENLVGDRTPAACFFPKKVPPGQIPKDQPPPPPPPAPEGPAQLTMF